MVIDFSAHGRATIFVEDNIVIIESIGPWNLEYFMALHIKLVNAIRQIQHDKYAVLLKLNGEAIAGQDCYNAHLNFIKQGNAKAVAINLSSCSTPVISRDLLSKIYHEAGLEHQFFADDHTAIHWLNSKLC
ncbi:hypothetical protein [Thalassotalea atypica]|uniref:hypothetical protein n=1 Tax=Thalassotalea atypica TaxID=2054316 RepID=UPI002574111F|nr:hypothetical protein [Thalassotalea atypica]